MSKFHSKKQRKRVMAIVKGMRKNSKLGKRIYTSEMNKGKTHDEAMLTVQKKLPERQKLIIRNHNLKNGENIIAHNKIHSKGKPLTDFDKRLINMSIMRDTHGVKYER